jgi:hypothetical protein
MGDKKYFMEDGRKTNICIDCKKACGGCSWSAVDPDTNKLKFEPVPGWTAEKVRLNVGHDSRGVVMVETYHITECPLFEKEDGERKLDASQITDEQFLLLKARWKRLGEI